MAYNVINNNIRKYIDKIISLVKKTFEVWSLNDPWTLSAAISYYTIISLPAILVIILSITGYFYNEQVVREEIRLQITRLMGPESAGQVIGMIDRARLSANTLWATAIGIITMIFLLGAAFTRVYAERSDRVIHTTGFAERIDKVVVKPEKKKK